MSGDEENRHSTLFSPGSKPSPLLNLSYSYPCPASHNIYFLLPVSHADTPPPPFLSILVPLLPSYFLPYCPKSTPLTLFANASSPSSFAFRRLAGASFKVSRIVTRDCQPVRSNTRTEEEVRSQQILFILWLSRVHEVSEKEVKRR